MTHPATFDCRVAFGEAMVALAAENPDVVALTNDAKSSSKLTAFAEAYPDRFVNVGIAEQNLIGIGAGLANAGKIAFVSGAACFLTARAMEQIKVDLAYSEADVKVCGVSSGVAYGALGATHHSIEDVPWMRAIPGMTVVVPAGPVETAKAVHAAAAYAGPVFLRISRMGVPRLYDEEYDFRIGRASVLREGDDVTIIANGTMVCRALEAADRLGKGGIQARVLNMATVSPLDTDAVLAAAEETGGIVTVEEANVHGGLGSAVAELVVQHRPVPMRILGVPGIFAPTGPVDFLFEHFGLTPRHIAEAAEALLP
jgi:transketolase